LWILSATLHRERTFFWGTVFVHLGKVSTLAAATLVAAAAGTLGLPAAVARAATGAAPNAAGSSAVALPIIDTATLTVTAQYPVPGGFSPQSLALTGGELWFSYAGVHPSDLNGIGSVDIGAAQPVASADPSLDTWQTVPLLTASPAAPGVLVADGTYDDYRNRIQVFHASQASPESPGTLVSTAEQASPLVSADMAITPDGKAVVVAGNAPQSGPADPADPVFRLDDLAVVGQYGFQSGDILDSVAIAPSGAVATGSFSLNTHPDVSVYAGAGGAPLR
jgi:hypothetical protein